MTFQIDTRACFSCISDKIYLEKFKHCNLCPSNKLLYWYNGENVKPLGIYKVEVECKGIVNNFQIYVLKNGGPLIVGRDFLNMYNLGIAEFNFVKENYLNVLIKEYHAVFSDGLGLFNKGLASINLKIRLLLRNFFVHVQCLMQF